MQVIFFIVMPQPCSADYDYIKISDPFLNKIPVGVPVFKCLSETSAGKVISVTASDLVSEFLMFTGYCNMIESEAFLEDLQVK